MYKRKVRIIMMFVTESKIHHLALNGDMIIQTNHFVFMVLNTKSIQREYF